MPKRTVNVKSYKRFKNGKWERVQEHERKILDIHLSEALLNDIRYGRAVRIEPVKEYEYSVSELSGIKFTKEEENEFKETMIARDVGSKYHPLIHNNERWVWIYSTSSNATPKYVNEGINELKNKMGPENVFVFKEKNYKNGWESTSIFVPDKLEKKAERISNPENL